jgi:hypothetical protein
MIDEVFDENARDARRIEPSADADRAMRRVVGYEYGARAMGAPSDAHATQFPAEVPAVQFRENRFQVVVLAPRGKQSFPPAGAAGCVNSTAHVGLEDMRQIAFAGFTRGPLAEDLGEQDLRQCFQHEWGRVRQHVRDLDFGLSVAQVNRAADTREGTERDAEMRLRSAQSQAAEDPREQRFGIGCCRKGERKLAR